jgi:pyruvate kinase
VQPGPRILRLKARKDERGRPLETARVFLCGVEARQRGEPGPDQIWMPMAWLRELTLGDELRLRDLRGKRRSLRVVRCEPDGVECETDRTIYLDEDTELRRISPHAPERAARPIRVPAQAQSLRLAPGDLLWLKADGSLGHPARLSSPASIACAVPELLSALAPGQQVWFDDGKIGATVEELAPAGVLLRIWHTRVGGAQLKGEKGINAPDADLSLLPLLSPADLAALAVAAVHADSVGLSFTRSARDVALLHEVLAERKLERLGVIVKIETRAGFEALPDILFEALKRPTLGVMIARGDLAVECGFERLAELQEEMLWLCEAARVPSIWATQVLEGLTKKGHASRAEITDAAMSERAECVMLNKGPYLREAVHSLRDVLARMRGHQEKKRSMLRPLRSVHLGSDRADA